MGMWRLAALLCLVAFLPATAAERREPPSPPWIALHLSAYEHDGDLEENSAGTANVLLPQGPI
jgi:hypothetical protein